MLFNSFHFVLFFIIITTLYFVIPQKFRWPLLLASSCYFYMVFIPIYILILGFTIVVDYFVGIYLEDTKGKRKRIFLVASLFANIGVLAIFKYYNFINDTLTTFLTSLGYNYHLPHLGIILPIGLSFHTFQAMSYTIEVYRGNQKAERNFGIYALYVMFYPQLVAGPIERPQNLLHQFREKHFFEYNRIADGLKQMLWGFFMKLVIADRLAVYVNAVYNHPYQHGGKTLALATIFFAFQIYCDFAGYSNIAIGAAKVLGFKLMTNFNRPYFSRTISEFWKRWHISLSTWFRDYFYIPIGGSRVKIPRWYMNLFLVFLISGLWHGANWTFIIWGALNGFYLVFAIVTEKIRARMQKFFHLDRVPFISKLIQISITFLLVCFAWIFFRAGTMKEAFYIVLSILRFKGALFFDFTTFTYGILGITFLLFIEYYSERKRMGNLPFRTNHWFKEHLAYAGLALAILMFGVFDGGQFIYFQF
jgi:alginate O-acetyltransferase complex protein AlgI